MTDKDAARNELSPSPRRKLWLTVALLIALVGMGISVYATFHHLEVKAKGSTDFACNINEAFSCDDVALSPYAEFAGIPVAVFGLGYFAAMAVLVLFGMGSTKSAREHIQAYVPMVVIGILVSLVMAYFSFVEVGAACISCIGIYSVTLLQAIALGVFRKEIPAGFDIKSATSGGATAAIALAFVVAGYSFVAPKPSENPPAIAGEGNNSMPSLAEEVKDIPVAETPYSGLGEDYRKGGDDARVVIQEFADFQCPGCSAVSEILDNLHRDFGDRILIVFRNYPLDKKCNSAIQSDFHDYACKAAVMARCAGQYGKFWNYHDLIFANQRELSEPKLREWGRQVGLTDEQVNTCWESDDLLAKIKDDIKLAQSLGVDSTPTLFINGKKVLRGRSYEQLASQIDALLN